LEPKDYKTFACFRSFHYIIDDVKNGIAIRAPYRPIKFAFASKTQKQNGKDTDIVYVCLFTATTTKELEFLLNHSRFGVDFYDHIDLRSVDSSRAVKMYSMVSALKTKGQSDLRDMCRLRDMPFTADLDTVRSMLAAKMVEEDDKRLRSHSQEQLNKTFMDTKVIEKMNQ
jgi:hypothetical protein